MRRPGQINLFTRRVARPPPSPEFHTHCMVADVLRRWADPAWRWTHVASGEYRTKATAARLKRMGTNRGWPDILCLSPNGVAHCLELKRRSKKLTEDQGEFAAWCEEHAVPHAVAYSFEDALGVLKQWGIVTNTIRIR